MIDQKLLKERRSRRLHQAAADSSGPSSAGSTSSTPTSPPSPTAASEKGTKISMTWSELEASIATTEETPDKRSSKKAAWATPEPPSFAGRRRDRPPLSASAKKSRSARSVASDTVVVAAAGGRSAKKSTASAERPSSATASTTPRGKSPFGRAEERQKIKIIMTSDDLSKSVAAASRSEGKSNGRTLDRDALRARRAKMLKERSKQSLTRGPSASPPTTPRSASDSSLKARIQSGILRGSTPPTTSERMTCHEDLSSESSGDNRSVSRGRDEVPKSPQKTTPATKNLVGDMEGECREEESSPSLQITKKSRDAAAKLALARAKARENKVKKTESPEFDQRDSRVNNTESPGLDLGTDNVPNKITPVPPAKPNSQELTVEADVSAEEDADKVDVAASESIPDPCPKSTEECEAVASSSTPTTRTPLKQLPLSVQRERARKRENRRSRTSSPSRTETRRNLDKRTARMRYSDDFRAEIEKHRMQQSTQGNSLGSRGGDADPYQREQNGISVFVRKRPLFDYEQQRNDYDVIEMNGAADGEDGYDRVTIHNCMMHPDMKRMFVQQVSFPACAAFDESCNNDDIFNKIADPLVKLAARGSVATILMYGQTGSGKTHTMSGIEERTADKLFDELTEAKVTVQFIELAGKSCKDLLGRGDEVKLAEEKDGTVRLVNATAAVVESSKDLARLIAKGKCRRATEATDMNGVSSRSHAVCQIGIRFPKRRRRGLLTLIDCAGSERRHDSMYHSSQRQKESAEINASLWALKECIRARKNGEVVPYRNSLLTRILRESFERDGAKLSVIATVAPNASDTEHSCETLKTVSTIVGCENMISEGEKHEVSPQRKKKPDVVPPRQWDHSQLVAFLARKKIDLKVPENIDGKTTMRMNVQQIRARLCKGNGDDKLPTLIFNALRKENDRVDAIARKEKLDFKKRRKQEDWENTTLYR